MKSLVKISLVCVAMVGLSFCSKLDWWNSIIPETDKEPTASGVTGFIFRPATVPATDENVKQLKVPPGFTVAKFAENLGKPRILAVSAGGHVYVSDREAGVVMMLHDNNDDGVSDTKQVVANIQQAHGLAVLNSTLYIVSVREVFTASINPDGTLGQPAMILNNLPDGGQHPNRTIDFGPDGKMYISIGSTCNSCMEPNPLHATIVQADPDGSNMKIFSSGLRNTIGFGWHPETKEMWGVDHGIDWLGDDEQKEELNQLKENAYYGWPYIYQEGKYNPQTRPPGDSTYQQYLSKTSLPTLTYQAHAAPMQMAFYKATTFPAEYQNDAFVAMRGSWNRSKAVGYKVVRIHFENGKPTQFDDFLTGFLIDNNKSHFGRLVGVAVHTDGSLLVSDDTNGVIYRVANN
jgi:glucose/arabinose dehydrogenase